MGRKAGRPRSTRTRGAERGRARRAAEIHGLCSIARHPEWAEDLIARRLPLEAARRDVWGRLAAENDAPGEIHTRPHPDGPPTDLRFKAALPAYLNFRERELARLEQERGAPATDGERQRREDDVARRGYRILVADHGLPDEWAAWKRLEFDRIRAALALRRQAPDDAPPLTDAGDGEQRRRYARALHALAALPLPAATDPLDVLDLAVLDAAVDALVQCGAARDRNEAARILVWRRREERTDPLAAVLRLRFRDEVGVPIERQDVREAAGGFAWKQPRQAAPVGRGRPRASEFTRGVVALDGLLRHLTGKANYRAVALALLYHGWDTHLRVDWPALQRTARTALFSAQPSVRAHAHGTLTATIRWVQKRVKETLDRARREDRRGGGCQETRPVV